MKFSELNIPDTIQKTLKKMGLIEMTPVQEATYPIISEGKDLCALAETGSGKTAACVIPLIQKIDVTQNFIQGLVIVPTRELCLQYVGVISKISAQTNVVPFSIFGGFSKTIQIAKLKDSVHILVATPGRLIDLLYDNVIDLSHVKCLILDEADELLDTGFLPDIEFIMSCMIHKHQTLLFSATMKKEIKQITENHLDNPEHISLVNKQAIPQSIQHIFSYVYPKSKYEEMKKIILKEDIDQMIIFGNSRNSVETLYNQMKKDFKDVEYIHAGFLQRKRNSIFTMFRNKKIKFLIATDIAGRGLDFSHISHIINWFFPNNLEQYTHRTGRSGRMGKTGRVITFVTRFDIKALKELLMNVKISPLWLGKNPLQNNTHINHSKIIKYSVRPHKKITIKESTST